ncbi:M20/M25/M40 family metallo-hydrolase [Breznakiella homolactica]|uniref:M20/M25/M40 family metallo-hydrolase n=1 Tax=Breznakiella homolactica TaxID=2798577 RepID=A0A7T7XNC2_9SPIR|nr:M20/M25/M40 family metallo-hydrolase [Breznakiella homolactica]QQO09524.1 M20/M25/M40 family metallo-hydrolase [Breznakiella homolactica]
MDVLQRFRKSIQIKTDWPEGAQAGDGRAEAPLREFQEFLKISYPEFHKKIERSVLNPYAVIYQWPGESAEAKPILFLAHYDVVPAETEKWTVPPFSGDEKDGYIYGRGTLDMKCILIGIMEAAETLCAGGFRPKQDIWFAFGGDEERAGTWGAKTSVRWFAERNIRFAWALDEGSIVARNQIAWIDKPLALLGIEEKGFASFELRAAQQSGHASRPPKVQAAAVLARALLRISKKPFPFRLTPTVEGFFRSLGDLSTGAMAWVLKHPRLLGPLFFKAVAGSPAIASLLRTTVAMTQLEGSPADNVMPSSVRAVLNLRLLDPWTVETALEYVRKAVNDGRVEVDICNVSTDPVPPNPLHAKRSGPGWEEMEAAVSAVFPGVPVMPFLVTATTDSRHYKDLCGGIFRFCPLVLTPEELALIHGHDERISEQNLRNCVNFYTDLLARL